MAIPGTKLGNDRNPTPDTHLAESSRALKQILVEFVNAYRNRSPALFLD